MRKYVLLLLAGLSVQLGHSQSTIGSGATLPTLTILPEDVEQESIRLIPSKDETNQFLLTWDYTESGVKKIRAFWSAHAGQMIRKRYGTYETKPLLASTNIPPVPSHVKGPKMHGILQLNAADANTVLTALKKRLAQAADPER
jgi:hypothetical protein